MCKRIKYLIVEDDTASVIITKWELISQGFLVDYEHVENEIQMRQKMLDNTFDVIISDHHMPSFTSLDALMIRNEVNPTVPFIILSIDIPAEAQQEALSRGCSAVINKVHIDLLARTIDQLTPDIRTLYSI